MKKRLAFLYRLPHLTIEEFREHYETRHVPYILERVPGIVRYIRNYPKGGAPVPWDVMTEVWFDDDDAYLATASKAESMNAIRQEESKFLDLARAQFMNVAENVTPAHLLKSVAG